MILIHFFKGLIIQKTWIKFFKFLRDIFWHSRYTNINYSSNVRFNCFSIGKMILNYPSATSSQLAALLRQQIFSLAVPWFPVPFLLFCTQRIHRFIFYFLQRNPLPQHPQKVVNRSVLLSYILNFLILCTDRHRINPFASSFQNHLIPKVYKRFLWKKGTHQL